MTNTYSWKPFFDEMLAKLCKEYDSQSLAKLLHSIFSDTSALTDRFKDGSSGPVKELDPLTFIGYFNRKLRDERRSAYCETARRTLNLSAQAPTDFRGIPIINNQASWFFPYEKDREPKTFKILWDFARALNQEELTDKLFADALTIKGVGLAKLTQICFICKPDSFLPFDKNTTAFLESKKLIPGANSWRDQLNYSGYKQLLESAKRAFSNKSFSEISHQAWDTGETPSYWLAGAHWSDRGEEADKTREFITQGVWLNGFAADSNDPSIEIVKQVSADDWIAIKSSSTKGANHDLTFTKIKAVGRVKENFGDGVRLAVEWLFDGPAFDLDGVSYRKTFQPARDQDINSIFGRFIGTEAAMPVTNKTENNFALPSSKNCIYWGPPGTGKTYKILQMQSLFRDSTPGNDEMVAWIQELGWWETIAAALIDLAKPVTVPELFKHEFVQLKSKQQPSNKTPKNTIWGQLQSHTITSSTTVNFERRQEPLVVDKSEDSKWSLVGDWQEQLEDLVEAVKKIRDGKTKTVNERFKVVTFHQSYSYEEFVEGIRPERTADGSGVSYQVRDGVFKLLCQRALENPEKEYAIFIDEINRGNISKIFGELITLIEEDKRIGAPHEISITLPYSGKRFGVPKNLYVIGTMNSVDRSIALVDMALRRRFEFITIRPNASLINPQSLNGIDLQSLFDKLNQKIAVILGTEYQIGHSYFMDKHTSSITAFKKTWFSSILPLLQEYLFDDWDKIEALVGSFVIKTEVKDLETLSLPRFSYGSFIDSDLSDGDFVGLLKRLA